jgi:hypothetical protein
MGLNYRDLIWKAGRLARKEKTLEPAQRLSNVWGISSNECETGRRFLLMSKTKYQKKYVS